MDAATDTGRVVRLFDFRRPEPPTFATAEAAWFWTMATLMARADGATDNDPTGTADSVVKVVDRLYRQRRIDLAHARILRIYGEKGHVPPPQSHGDDRLWREAIARMAERLRGLGIVRRGSV